MLATRGGDSVEDDEAGVVGEAELMVPVVDSLVLLMNRTMGVGVEGTFGSWLVKRDVNRTTGAL